MECLNECRVSHWLAVRAIAYPSQTRYNGESLDLNGCLFRWKHLGTMDWLKLEELIPPTSLQEVESGKSPAEEQSNQVLVVGHINPRDLTEQGKGNLVQGRGAYFYSVCGGVLFNYGTSKVKGDKLTGSRERETVWFVEGAMNWRRKDPGHPRGLCPKPKELFRVMSKWRQGNAYSFSIILSRSVYRTLSKEYFVLEY